MVCAIVMTAVQMPALAASLVGKARVVDGDTLVIRGHRIRLHGIDAPERAQTCRDHTGRKYRCGARATAALVGLVRRRPVRCISRGRDRYRRMIGVCRAGRVVLNREMVRLGWAVAYRRYSQDYLTQELEAAKANRGIWQGGFQRPGAYRAARRSGAGRVVSDQKRCLIKGNISTRGRIYHLPDSRSYSRTRIDTAKGERWFCSEAQAVAAGWRAPRN